MKLRTVKTIKFLLQNQFSFDDVWFKSALGGFSVGIDGNMIVFFQDGIDQSVIIADEDPIPFIRNAMIQEVIES